MTKELKISAEDCQDIVSIGAKEKSSLKYCLEFCLNQQSDLEKTEIAALLKETAESYLHKEIIEIFHFSSFAGTITEMDLEDALKLVQEDGSWRGATVCFTFAEEGDQKYIQNHLKTNEARYEELLEAYRSSYGSS